ncbi:MAG: hypothetical protein A4S12_11820 [Proteobacteria bacterium SG_bin5]|nr:ABC transporter ATP-binding protein/permease [Sphingomonas sp.]OQW39026.1 MAG: hypothetical protein A4S12_11820 [Proteobacteria bacterium SG_bin5]
MIAKLGEHWRPLGVLYRAATRARRRDLLGLLPLTTIAAFAELVSLGALVPFITILATPQRAAPLWRLAGLERALGPVDPNGIVWIGAGVFAALLAFSAVFRFLVIAATAKFAVRLGTDLSTALLTKVLAQSYAYHSQINSAEILTAFEKVRLICQGVIVSLLLAASSLIMALFIAVGLLIVDWRLALGSVFLVGLTYVLVSVIVKGMQSRNGVIVSQLYPRRSQVAQEALGGIRDVILDHSQDVFIARFSALDARIADAQASNLIISSSPRTFIESFGMLLIVGATLMLSARSGGLASALPALGALALGAQRLLPLFQQIYAGWSQFRGNHALLVDVVAFLSLPDAPVQAATPRLGFEREIALERVRFRYRHDQPLVIDDISMTIQKGERVAIIGATGSGKSTLMDIVLGLLTPSDGVVRIDGARLDAEHVRAWQRVVAHVPQNIFLSDGSFAQNIAFGLPEGEIDMAKVRDAARRAGLADVIADQPLGYDQIIGERGVRLSGGQRQRIGIARALYKDAAVLVFDEATSALDMDTERRVMSSIESLDENLTVILIAHRLSTVRHCDRVYRLDRGKLIDVVKGSEVEAAAAVARSND